MKQKTRLFSLLIVFLIVSACNLPSNNPQDATSTAAAQTVEAMLSATPVPGLPTASFTPLPVPATLTPIPLPVSNTPSMTPTTNCNVAQFITDVTIPDGTLMTPSQAFTKKWRIKNIGTCTWSGFSMVFDSGDSMGGPASKAISTLGPGQEIDLEVNLTAPSTPGNYRGYWRINTNGNVLVPVVSGYQGKSFYVDIKVQNPATATNTLSPATAQVVLNAISGESGTLYEPAAGVPSTVLAGDTSSNEIARGFMSFDISTLSGKTIKTASLSLTGCSAMQDPFTGSLAGIWVGEVQYPLPLDQSDYNIAGTGIVLLNALPGPIDVKSYVQSRATEGKARFQIRLHPAGPTDNDGNADYMSCNANSVTLTITYQP